MDKTLKLKKPVVPEGWTIESDIGQDSFVPAFSLHLEPEQEKGYIIGTELQERLKGKDVMSAAVLDYLLEHTELIPEAWKGKYIFFWGTVYRDSCGGLCVRCLFWDGDGWSWGSFWLGYGFVVNGPALLRAGSETLSPSYSDTLNLAARLAKVEAILKH
ncbi:MAG: hypothetical protein B7W98_02790, partial [Parcubacteria group bacterium 20-58-5]